MGTISDGRWHHRIQQKKQNKKNNRLSPNINNNNHNRFATLVEDDEEEEESSEVAVLTSVVFDAINDRNKKKTIKNTTVRHKEENEKESDWEKNSRVVTTINAI